KHTTVIEDHVKHITVFPSLKPVGRNEVMKLRHTMDALLQRITIENNDERGQTQPSHISPLFYNLFVVYRPNKDSLINKNELVSNVLA
ncbi:unnamed protein product, partial [Didymodactylos carnosus]